MSQKYLVSRSRIVGAMNRSFMRGIGLGLSLAALVAIGRAEFVVIAKLLVGSFALLVAGVISQKMEEKVSEK